MRPERRAPTIQLTARRGWTWRGDWLRAGLLVRRGWREANKTGTRNRGLAKGLLSGLFWTLLRHRAMSAYDPKPTLHPDSSDHYCSDGVG
jgi:hypothetical protein